MASDDDASVEITHDDARDESRCGVFCDATPEVSFEAFEYTFHWCRDCYEEPCSRCGGDIEDGTNKAKGWCQSCREEIRLITGGDNERGIEKEPDSKQTTLLTDGGRETSEAALEFECRNCRSETTEFDDCPVCGAAPHKGEGYRIKCLDCGSIAFGDWGADVQHDMWHHRNHYCPDAEFEVSALE